MMSFDSVYIRIAIYILLPNITHKAYSIIDFLLLEQLLQQLRLNHTDDPHRPHVHMHFEALAQDLASRLH